MARRGPSAAATRRRIVDAAIRIHARRGAAGMSWDELAQEAGVSRATAYHHFPSLDDLVPACAQVAFAMIAVPTPDEAAGIFSGLAGAEERLSHLARETCRCYAAGADWLRAAWRERDLVPPMGSAVDRLQTALGVLIEAALDGRRLTAERRAAITALLDFATWDGLRRAGVPEPRIAAHLERLCAAELG